MSELDLEVPEEHGRMQQDVLDLQGLEVDRSMDQVASSCLSSHGLAGHTSGLGSPSYGSGSEISSEAAQLAARMRQMLPVVAGLVSSMRVTHPGVLRGTPAYRPFQRCGQAFNPGSEEEFSKKSFEVKHITTFWSHSWRGPRWPKALTLMVIYNGQIAVCMGTLAAFLMMILFSFQLLPGFSRLAWADFHLFSCWSTMTGSIVSFLTFIFWRPQQLVFFDRMCIPENDSRLKAEAIYSLAGILKSSSKMLVLWDTTWSERLWCLFELAAFLKSQKALAPQGGGQSLEIRPTFLGPSMLFVFLTIFAGSIGLVLSPVSSHDNLMIPIGCGLLAGSAVGWMAISALRSYFRSIEALEAKLQWATLEGTRCTCCDEAHLDRRGQPMLCDREVVKECLKSWFGSEEEFEKYVRSEVWHAMSLDLQERVFSANMSRAVCAPVLWAFMDLAASYMQFLADAESGLPWIGWGFLVDGLVIQLILCPFVFHIVVFLARRFRRRGASFCSEVFRNFFVVLCAVMALGLAAAFYVSGWAIFVRGGIFVLGFPRSSYFAGPLLTAWLLHQVHQRCTKKVPKSQAGRRHGLPGHSLEEGAD
ncbi:unnamed protein product [Durusdinium trenchii]|uniref:Uncharacterized protein n=2 Tax=Durusdinium trenchii TaxID=1381693 RepID=A0ABP0RG41_9DINO